jgi:hypothetical protein
MECRRGASVLHATRSPKQMTRLGPTAWGGYALLRIPDTSCRCYPHPVHNTGAPMSEQIAYVACRAKIIARRSATMRW